MFKKISIESQKTELNNKAKQAIAAIKSCGNIKKEDIAEITKPEALGAMNNEQKAEVLKGFDAAEKMLAEKSSKLTDKALEKEWEEKMQDPNKKTKDYQSKNSIYNSANNDKISLSANMKNKQIKDKRLKEIKELFPDMNIKNITDELKNTSSNRKTVFKITLNDASYIGSDNIPLCEGNGFAICDATEVQSSLGSTKDYIELYMTKEAKDKLKKNYITKRQEDLKEIQELQDMIKKERMQLVKLRKKLKKLTKTTRSLIKNKQIRRIRSSR